MSPENELQQQIGFWLILYNDRKSKYIVHRIIPMCIKVLYLHTTGKQIEIDTAATARQVTLTSVLCVGHWCCESYRSYSVCQLRDVVSLTSPNLLNVDAYWHIDALQFNLFNKAASNVKLSNPNAFDRSWWHIPLNSPSRSDFDVLVNFWLRHTNMHYGEGASLLCASLEIETSVILNWTVGIECASYLLLSFQ